MLSSSPSSWLALYVKLSLSLSLSLVRNQNGFSAFLLACAHGHLDVARWLVTDVDGDALWEETNVGRLWLSPLLRSGLPLCYE